MIEIKNVTKCYGKLKAVDDISMVLREGEVFGMIGTNGAGKSTMLRMLAGVIKADGGSILVDDEEVWDNPEAKEKLFFISDEQYFFKNGTPHEVAKFYNDMYEHFNMTRCLEMFERFSLGKDRKIQTFSKGMKKQLAIIIGVCAGTKYLLMDETFDGLDPVMRQGMKSIFAAEMQDRDFAPVIASHNLRELEDICDHVGLLHRGGVLLSKDLAEMKTNIHKIQCVLPEGTESVLDGLDILSIEKRGSLSVITVRGDRENILTTIGESKPVFIEALPLSLEEIFISETGGVGYDIKNIIF